MPTKEQLTEEMISIYKEYLKDITSDTRRYTCKTTIQMYIIQLFETSQAVTSYNSDLKFANVNGLKKVVDNWKTITDMRNVLAHNNYNVGVGNEFYEYIIKNLNKFTHNDYKRLIKVCGADDIYNFILRYCDRKIKETESIIADVNNLRTDLPDV